VRFRRKIALLVVTAIIGITAISFFGYRAYAAGVSAPDVGVPAGVSLGSDYQLNTLAAMSPAQQATVMASIAGTGASWIRVDYSDEPAEGAYSYNLDGMISAATTAGLNVDAILALPTWSRNADGTPNVAMVATSMEHTAAHLATIGVHTFEIVNEANLNIDPTTGISVAAYTQILQAIYPVIHSNDSAATILAGGSALVTSSATQLSSIDYLTQMYADGAAGSFDGLAIHPYIYPFLPEIQTSWNPWTFLPSLHALMVANGDGSKLIWYTEFGAPTSGTTQPVTPQVQALSYTQAFAVARSWSWSGPLFAFNWQDSADGDFGLHDSQGDAKPALLAFEQAAGGPAVAAAAPADPPVTTITSADYAVFTVQVGQTFSVQATGSLAPTITESGTLPAGLTFSSGVLWGTPTPTAGGIYPLTFTADDGGGAVTQSFTLTVHMPPVVASTNIATFTVATHGSFPLSLLGTPAPTVTESGALPSGVQYSGDVLSGTPAAGTQGVYPVTFDATNGQSPDAVQQFQLTVVYGWPTVSAVAPALGPVTGGTTVTITGTNFTSASAVSFGNVPATRFNVSSPTQITAIAPPQGSGAHSIRVTTPGGISAIVPADTFTYPASVPVITTLDPSAGPAAGGNSVTITGGDFTAASAVLFGNVAASSFTVDSGTQITAVAPSEGAGSHPVTVTTPGGSSDPGAAPALYTIAAPAITAIVPGDGPAVGATTVTITGSGFTAATAVQFGNVAASSFTVDSPTLITAVAPAEAAGSHPITVTAPGGTSAAGAASLYVIDVPAISAISPATGPTSGGAVVTITGSGLTGATAVQFGAVAASSFTVVSPTQISAVSPPQAAAAHNIVVVSAGGTSTAGAGSLYTYASPAVAAISPSGGSSAGGDTVTITGSGFTGASTVLFGAEAASTFTVVSATQITAVSPSQSGSHYITVVTPGGVSPPVTAALYVYALPIVASVAPTSGPTGGGNTVTITGTGLTSTTAVKFGASAASSFKVVSSTQITAVSPAQAAGAHNITVITAGGTTGTGPGTVYTYAAPTVVSVSPASGSVQGGATVTITGTGFTGATSVLFGAVAASSFTVVSPTTITAVAPAEAAGAHNVFVITPSGQTASGSGTLYTFS
jgi:hypothetical protein